MTSPTSAQKAFPVVTFDLTQLTIAHLRDATTHLQAGSREPLRCLLAARSLHLALVTLLTEAVAGSSGVEAFEPKLRTEWWDFFERSRDENIAPPQGDRVMSFKELLRAAKRSPPPGWFSSPLTLTPASETAIDQLTALRDWVEHPRPRSHLISTGWFADPIRAGADLAKVCFELVRHHFEVGEEAEVRSVLSDLVAASYDLED